MELDEMRTYLILVAASIAFFALAVYFSFIRKFKIGNKHIGVSRLMLVSGLMLACAFFLRLAVGLFMDKYPPADYTSLESAEQFFNSLVHALQTFSMDEDYTQYLREGKRMVGMMDLPAWKVDWVRLMGLYTAIVNIVSPVVGGTLLLDILANLLPGFRLRLANLKLWRPKYYFNELNERSILLADSLVKLKDNNPVIVFTKAGKNASEDLLDAAKKLDAICMKEDLEHIKKCKVGARSYFLISENENANLRTLAGLSQQSCGGYLAKANIYLFTTTDAYVQLESKMYENLIRWGLPEKKLPLLYPVRTAHNMIANLLNDVPLYEPLIHKAKKEKLELKLTILGCGTYGMEMLLSSYSFGQMLDCKLNITVVSREKPQDFWDKLHASSPEFLDTTKESHPILQYNHNGDCNDPYCSIQYISCDVRSEEFLKIARGYHNGVTIRDTDYFLISLGDDSRNIDAAELLTRYIGEWHLYDRDARTVIACVVTDSDMDRLLGEQHSVKETIYLHVIGGFHEVYGANNVLLLSHTPQSNSLHAKYKMHNRADELKKQEKRRSDSYSFYSSAAKVMHLRYRIFCTSRMLVDPWIEDSVFTTQGHQSARYVKAKELAYANYLQFLASNGKTAKAKIPFEQVMHRLAWMEHRRWSAYIRASGFRYTDKYMTYATGPGTHKNLKLKLHPCLVECSKDGILAKILPEGKVQKYSLKIPTENPKEKPTEDYPTVDAWMAAHGRETIDRLDALSFELNINKINNYDFKFYDYPVDHYDKNEKLLPLAKGKIEEQQKKQWWRIFKRKQDAQKATRNQKSDQRQNDDQSNKKEKTHWLKMKKTARKLLKKIFKKPNWVENLEDLLFSWAFKDGALSYKPDPMCLAFVKVPSGWKTVREEAARAIHEAWKENRKADRWSLGPMRDDGLLTTPRLVEYDDLPNSSKKYDCGTADATVKCLIALGYSVEPKTDANAKEKQAKIPKIKLDKLAQNVHERWAKRSKARGWTWGEIRNEAKRITPCMIPYASLPDIEKKYDLVTVKSVLDVIEKHYVITEEEEHDS